MQPLILLLKRARFIRRGAWSCIVLLVTLSQAIPGLPGETGEIAKISVHRLRDLLDRPDTVVLDVRTYRNWWRSSKKIPTAVRVDPTRVDQWRGKYGRDHTLIFYCS